MAIERTMEQIGKDPIYSQKIDYLELSVRAEAIVKGLDALYIGELMQKSEADVLHAPQSGRKYLNEIKEVLGQVDLALETVVTDHPGKIEFRGFLQACVEKFSASAATKKLASDLANTPSDIFGEAAADVANVLRLYTRPGYVEGLRRLNDRFEKS